MGRDQTRATFPYDSHLFLNDFPLCNPQYFGHYPVSRNLPWHFVVQRSCKDVDACLLDQLIDDVERSSVARDVERAPLFGPTFLLEIEYFPLELA